MYACSRFVSQQRTMMKATHQPCVPATAHPKSQDGLTRFHKYVEGYFDQVTKPNHARKQSRKELMLATRIACQQCLSPLRAATFLARIQIKLGQVY